VYNESYCRNLDLWYPIRYIHVSSTYFVGMVMDTLLTIKGCLTPEQFTVVMLKTVKEMTYANVGDHIGKSAASARSIHAKALLRLKRKLNGTRVRSYSN
tara:strand:- start:104 stop:400 length:297 start_codon:yes stop_codon:yes gene_type:complete